jgi:hypothetical protein
VAIVQWYENCEDEDYHLGCPKLKLIESYSMIPIASIDRSIHIVPRFGKSNEYLVNIFHF